eukprot:5398827-Prorocentrum_lima.AAC.1
MLLPRLRLALAGTAGATPTCMANWLGVIQYHLTSKPHGSQTVGGQPVDVKTPIVQTCAFDLFALVVDLVYMLTAEHQLK